MTPSFVQRATQAARGAVRMTPGEGAAPSQGAGSASSAVGSSFPSAVGDAELLDLNRRRDQLNAKVAELQWDLGGLVYEMAIRDRIRVDVIVRRAAELQNADAELGEIERILRLEQTSTAGQCGSCAAPHSSGAAYCWQCGQPLLQEVHSEAIAAP
jgi:chorismate mutase